MSYEFEYRYDYNVTKSMKMGGRWQIDEGIINIKQLHVKTEIAQCVWLMISLTEDLWINNQVPILTILCSMKILGGDIKMLVELGVK